MNICTTAMLKTVYDPFDGHIILHSAGAVNHHSRVHPSRSRVDDGCGLPVLTRMVDTTAVVVAVAVAVCTGLAGTPCIALPLTLNAGLGNVNPALRQDDLVALRQGLERLGASPMPSARRVPGPGVDLIATEDERESQPRQASSPKIAILSAYFGSSLRFEKITKPNKEQYASRWGYHFEDAMETSEFVREK